MNARQARRQQDVAEFDLAVKYKPGSTMQKADALTRKTGDSKEGAEMQSFPEGTFLRMKSPITSLEGRSPRQILALEQANDSEADNANSYDTQNLDMGIEVDTWERNSEGLLTPPDDACKLEILRTCHDSGIAGHWGRHRAQELVSRNFW